MKKLFNNEIKALTVLFTVLILSTSGIAFDLNFNYFGGEKDGEIEAMEEFDINLCGDIDKDESNWLEIDIEDNETNTVFINQSNMSTSFCINEIDVSELNDGNLTATGNLIPEADEYEIIDSTDADVMGRGFSDYYANYIEIQKDFEIAGFKVWNRLEDNNFEIGITDDGSGYSGHVIGPQEFEATAEDESFDIYLFDGGYEVSEGEEIGLLYHGIGAQDTGLYEFTALNSEYYDYTGAANAASYEDLSRDSTFDPYTIRPLKATEISSDTDNITAEKNTSLDYDAEKDISIEWGFDERKAVFNDDIVEDAYTITFEMSDEADYVDIEEINTNEYFLADNVTIPNTKATLNVSDMEVGESRSWTFDLDLNDITDSEWQQIVDNAPEDIFTVQIEAIVGLEDVIQFEKVRNLEALDDTILTTVRRALQPLFDSLFNILETLLSPVFNAITWVLNSMLNAIVWIGQLIYNVIVTVITLLLQIVIGLISSIGVLISNLVQYAMFYHHDLMVEVDGIHYDDLETAQIGLQDIQNDNVEIKSVGNQSDVFTGGVWNTDNNLSLQEYRSERIIYEASLFSLTSQKPSDGATTELNVSGGN